MPYKSAVLRYSGLSCTCCLSSPLSLFFLFLYYDVKVESRFLFMIIMNFEGERKRDYSTFPGIHEIVYCFMKSLKLSKYVDCIFHGFVAGRMKV